MNCMGHILPGNLIKQARNNHLRNGRLFSKTSKVSAFYSTLIFIIIMQKHPHSHQLLYLIKKAQLK